MPKKKNNGLSNARVPMQAGEYESRPESRAHGASGSVLTQADSSWGFNNFGSTLSSSGQSESQSRDEIILNMQEMFSHLDSGVIYMVLHEEDFKVDNAVNSLLELSDAAEGTAPPPPPVSGFELAAALLGADSTQSGFAFSQQTESQRVHSPHETHLTREFNTLLDQELETLTSPQTQPSTHSLMSSVPFFALPPPSQSLHPSSLPLTSQTPLSGPQNALELEQNPKPGSVTEQASYSSPRLSEACGGISPVSEMRFGGVHIPELNSISLDFSHLTMEASSTEPWPSTFQVYSRPDQLHNQTGILKHNEALRTPAMFWKTQAAESHSQTVGPAFIAPVIPNPTPWNTNPFPAAQWLDHGPIREAPPKPFATVPKSWTLPPKSRLKLEGRVLVLLRGAPGSGKTTLANAMLEHNPGGVVLSTDEYFTRNGPYHFEPNLLGEAHEWNHQRAKEALKKGQTPIIIDNTNIQCWEMKPYVAMAQKHMYKVLFREPDTWWKTKPRELEKRTRHQVTKKKIKRMLERYDRFVSVQSIINSQRPEPVPSVVDLTQTEIDQPQQSLPPGLNYPDLVGNSGLIKPNVDPSTCLPDLSSVSQACDTISTGEEEGEMESYSSKESMVFHETILAESGMLQSDLLDGEELDLELDTCFVKTEKKIENLGSETIEEFGMTAKEMFLEQPVAFSESIAQRVRRDRTPYANVHSVSRVRVNRVSAIDQPVDFDPNVESSRQVEEGCEDEPLAESKVMQPELLDFVGDWPLESQSQRQRRQQNSSNKSVKNTNKESRAVEGGENASADVDKHSDTDMINEEEFVDLRQGGGSSSPANLALKHSPSLGRNEGNLNLETVLWPKLPDCVLEWKFSECTDPRKDYSTSPSPVKEGADQIESSHVSTQEVVEEEGESVVSEEKCRMSPSVQGTLCSRVAVDLESSLERWRGLRMGKSCKLALPFTDQSLSSPCTQFPVISHQPSNLSPGEGIIESCPSISTQTHPQNFALLWGINQLKCSASASDLSSSDMVIFYGNSLRFTPKTNEEQSACQQGVSYRIIHEKGSQVEDSDLRESQSKQQNLEILGRHFRHVYMDILEDLYEKCQQDMEWRTNLLLDSGERLYKDDKENEEGHLGSFFGEQSHDYQAVKKFPITEPTEAGSESNQAGAEQNVADSSSIRPKSQETNLSDLSQANEDWSAFQSSQSEAEGSDEGLSIYKGKCEPEHYFVTLGQSKEDTKAQLNVPAASEAKPEPDTTDQLISQSLEAPLEQWSQEERGVKEKEEEETRAKVDAITQSLLHQVNEMECRQEEENTELAKDRKRTGQERREPRTLDIQTLELKLPTELALQLTELFGPVGVSPGTGERVKRSNTRSPHTSLF
ncbi:NEDD4-binding protein 2-like [Xyrauchen texanus]|uniref:NEDD4-binding protein 2-like n=1 Tax=Xyrauchen texanus TaxID=154827 RepID=UPI0022427AB3|nr:NEDD4-binding protein 2-like [Xyrauchen texanus]